MVEYSKLVNSNLITCLRKLYYIKSVIVLREVKYSSYNKIYNALGNL